MFVAWADVNPIGVVVFFQGQDAFSVKTFSDVGAAVGAAVGFDVSASVKETNYWFTGNISTFRAKDFEGKRLEFNAAISVGADVGVSISVSQPENKEGYLIGVGLSAGAGIPTFITGNANLGRTILHE